MFIEIKHKELDIYKAIREFIGEAYKLSVRLPSEEKFNMVLQLRKAALSVKLNFSEGSSRRSVNERRRFYEIARGSLIEVDAVLEVAIDLKYCSVEELKQIAVLLKRYFAMLTKMIEIKEG